MSKNRLITPVLVLLILLTGVISGTKAQAHAFLVESEPNAQATLKKLPTIISLKFNENISVNKAGTELLAPNGVSLPFKIELTNDTLIVTPEYLSEEMKGTYILKYSLLSKDGHIISDFLQFNYLTPSKIESNQVSLKAMAKVCEVVSWVLIFLLASINRRKKPEWALAILAFSILLLVVNFSYLNSEIGDQILRTNPGRYLLALTISVLAAYFAESKLFYALSAISFSSLALYSGHSLTLPKLEMLSKLMVALHLLAAYIWSTQVLRLKFNLNLEQLRVTRRLSSYSVFLTLLAGCIPLTIIILNSSPELNSAWVTFILIKLSVVSLILLLALKHHRISEAITTEKLTSMKRGLNVESAFFIIVLLLAGGLTANGVPSSNKLEKQESGFIYFDNGVASKITVEGEGQDKILMLDFKENIELVDSTIKVSSENRNQDISKEGLELSGGPNHFMGKMTLPFKGKWFLTFSYFQDEFTEVKGEFTYEFK